MTPTMTRTTSESTELTSAESARDVSESTGITDAADAAVEHVTATENGSDSTGLTRVLVIGALPGVGASTLAWSLAQHAGHHLSEVDLFDVASPRRSTLRDIGSHTGRPAHVESGMRLVPVREGNVTIRFIESHLDTRFDRPEQWPATGEVQVVDLGVSAEEALDVTASAWLHEPEARIVLVVPTAPGWHTRCEVLLGEWVKRGFTPIDTVVARGPQVPLLSGTPFMEQALETPLRLDYEPVLAAARIGSVNVPALDQIAQRINSELLGLHVPDPAPVKARRWRR